MNTTNSDSGMIVRQNYVAKVSRNIEKMQNVNQEG